MICHFVALLTAMSVNMLPPNVHIWKFVHCPIQGTEIEFVVQRPAIRFGPILVTPNVDPLLGDRFIEEMRISFYANTVQTVVTSGIDSSSRSLNFATIVRCETPDRRRYIPMIEIRAQDTLIATSRFGYFFSSFVYLHRMAVVEPNTEAGRRVRPPIVRTGAVGVHHNRVVIVVINEVEMFSAHLVNEIVFFFANYFTTRTFNTDRNSKFLFWTRAGLAASRNHVFRFYTSAKVSKRQ